MRYISKMFFCAIFLFASIHTRCMEDERKKKVWKMSQATQEDINKKLQALKELEPDEYKDFFSLGTNYIIIQYDTNKEDHVNYFINHIEKSLPVYPLEKTSITLTKENLFKDNYQLKNKLVIIDITPKLILEIIANMKDEKDLKKLQGIVGGSNYMISFNMIFSLVLGHFKFFDNDRYNSLKGNDNMYGNILASIKPEAFLADMQSQPKVALFLSWLLRLLQLKHYSCWIIKVPFHPDMPNDFMQKAVWINPTFNIRSNIYLPTRDEFSDRFGEWSSGEKIVCNLINKDLFMNLKNKELSDMFYDHTLLIYNMDMLEFIRKIDEKLLHVTKNMSDADFDGDRVRFITEKPLIEKIGLYVCHVVYPGGVPPEMPEENMTKQEQFLFNKLVSVEDLFSPGCLLGILSKTCFVLHALKKEGSKKPALPAPLAGLIVNFAGIKDLVTQRINKQ